VAQLNIPIPRGRNGDIERRYGTKGGLNGKY
jgi:hypothetical protein